MKKILAILAISVSSVCFAQVDEIRRLAEQGNAQAQSALGFLLLNEKGFEQGSPEAAPWLRKAAEKGNAPAQGMLAFLLENGMGVVKNDVEAVAWYRKAAEQGEALAQNNLGYMLANGLGVVKNVEEAYFWALLSAASNPAYRQFRDDMEARLKPAQRQRIQDSATKWQPTS